MLLSSVIAIAFTCLVPSLAGAQAPSKPAEQKPKARSLPALIVFDIIPEKGVEPGTANLLTEIVLDKVTKTGRFQVIGMKEIDKMLTFEQNKQLKGCTDTQCLVQIAGALGAMYYVEGSIGAMGEVYLVTLKMIDATDVKVLSRDTRRIKQDETALMDGIEKMIAGILGSSEQKKEAAVPHAAAAPREPPTQAKKAQEGAARKEPEPVRKSAPRHWTGIWGPTLTFTGAGVVGIGGVFTYVATTHRDKVNTAPTAASMDDARDKVGLYNGLAVAGYVIGSAMTVTGIVIWAVGAGRTAPAQSLNVTPVITGGFAGIGASGVW
jgi:TolB-like protein